MDCKTINMKKLLYLLLLIAGAASAQSPVNGSYGRFRDYVSSYTANSNLTTYGRGSGFVDVQDTLRLSGLSGSTFPYINVNKLVTGVSASTFMTNLGGTTIGQAVFTSTNPSAIRFGRANADNTFDWLSASDFRTAIGVVPVTFGTAFQIPFTNSGATDLGYSSDFVWNNSGSYPTFNSVAPVSTSSGFAIKNNAGTSIAILGVGSSSATNSTWTGNTVITGDWDITGSLDVDNININGNTITASSGSIEVSVGGANNATLLTTGAGEAGLQSQGTSSSSRVSAYNNVILDYDTDNSSAGTLLLRRNGVTLYTLNNGGDWDKWGFVSGGFLADANGNEWLEAPTTVASAVNHLKITNAATGNRPKIEAVGGDTNIGIEYAIKGTENHYFSSGNVGIGVTPTEFLHVQKNQNASTKVLVENTDVTNSTSRAVISAKNGTVDAQIIAIGSGGEAYIGTFSSHPLFLMTQGNARLYIANDGKIGVGRNSSTNAFEVEGNASKTASGDWLANSDRRIKTEVETISGAWDRIKGVRPVTFKYDSLYRAQHPSINDKFYQNVIAQEYEEIYPDFVYESDTFNGNKIKQVDTHPMMMDAVKALQEALVKIEELEARIEELEK